MNTKNAITIIPFSADLKEPFKELNYEWLKKYFKIEPKDKRVLSNPQEEIIDKGGMIFYAKYHDKIVGTVALINIDKNLFELSKMAVTDDVQGLGIGKKLLQHCIEAAEKQKIKTLLLYSNRSLVPAIHLYHKFGFVEVPLEEGVYERADIKMRKNIYGL
ncbi:GNAT family N-acetyltransferase [Flavobacterium sp. K5-23]|uniref:GNAT family N-acetyltransferase n=1 Tax=Flavobacterium sp. K5-23 TaxID=2746225 RepID=UPI00200D7F81|nr:GNAT family N-acetyltransferase [Flavobacterium sp. K5-23]UQD56952.1 GNAT family N-acetyltransferase [Flavobacterium sp. K5-23]